MRSFKSQVSGWAQRTKRAQTFIVRDAYTSLFQAAQLPVSLGGNMPVATGFLQDSLTMSVNGAPAGSGARSYVGAIATMRADSSIEGVWKAPYARYVEEGARGVPPRKFRAKAVLRWQAFVRRAVSKAKGIR